MLRYYITDRRSIGGTAALLQNVERLGAAIDILQVREKDLGARELANLVRALLRAAHPSVAVLVNDRADIAIACGAHGLHLRSNSIAVSRIREILPATFRISVSCHSVEDVKIASLEGADYALLSPVFASPGKGVPLGLEKLSEAARASSTPVIALGGVTDSHLAACALAGAAGFAAIRYFQGPL